MVRDTVDLLRSREGRRVFLDCEHFFDGFRFDPDVHRPRRRRPRWRPAPRSWSCATPTAACCPSRITAAIGEVAERLRRRPPTGSASTARTTPPARWPTPSPPSRPGVRHFQCTANGYGERPGNADLFAVVANLQLKLGLPVLPDGCLEQMVRVSHAIAEIANIAPDTHQAYVGAAGLRPQGGAARERDQGGSGALQPRRPGRRRQRHADPGHRDGRPGQHRAQEPRARSRPGRPSGRRCPAVTNRVKELEARRLVVRGRRRLVRAAGARGAAGRRRRRGRSRWSRTGCWSSTARTARWSPRRPSRCGYAASGSSPPPRATARSTRSTRRCGWR